MRLQYLLCTRVCPLVIKALPRACGPTPPHRSSITVVLPRGQAVGIPTGQADGQLHSDQCVPLTHSGNRTASSFESLWPPPPDGLSPPSSIVLCTVDAAVWTSPVCTQISHQISRMAGQETNDGGLRHSSLRDYSESTCQNALSTAVRASLGHARPTKQGKAPNAISKPLLLLHFLRSGSSLLVSAREGCC